jgi:DNA-binding CsgD family transcriptional regulator
MTDAIAHFDRVIRRFGVQAWTAERMTHPPVFGHRQPVVALISSPEMTAWNAHYRKMGYARYDPLVAYGRGPNRARVVASFGPATALEQRIVDDRAAHGFDQGMIVPLHPLNTGGFVTLWGVAADILERPYDPTWQEVVGYCHYLGERGDFSDGVRQHARGERLSDREAAVVRPLLAGKSVPQIAEDLGIKPRSVETNLDRARSRLIGLGLLPEWAGRDAAAIAADELGLLP